MNAEAKSGSVLLVIVSMSLCAGIIVWQASAHVGMALICGLLAFRG